MLFRLYGRSNRGRLRFETTTEEEKKPKKKGIRIRHFQDYVLNEEEDKSDR